MLRTLTPRILVVDDDPGMRRSLAIMLRRERYEVTEAGSVIEAVAQLRREDYALLIADLMMEPLNGLDLLGLVPRYQPACRAIVITAFGTPETRSEALWLGALDFLEKPLDPPRLLVQIRDILNRPGTLQNEMN